MPIMAKNGVILARPTGGILATSCGVGGVDPYCTNCPASAGLKPTYEITLSGMPPVCTVHAFNGTWTVTWESNCHWTYQIDPWRSVALTLGTPWLVSWGIIAGPAGDFLGTDIENLKPETGLWIPNDCFEPFGCWGLATQYFANAVCVVA